MGELFFVSTFNGGIVYSRYTGVDLRTATQLMVDLGHTGILETSEAEHVAQVVIEQTQERLRMEAASSASVAAISVLQDKGKTADERLDAIAKILTGK